MAGEWIGLIGTAIGTGIGATAAVGSLVIRARQEASAEERRHQRDQKIRGRERAWEITLAGLEARRAVYISLIEVVTAYKENIMHFAEAPPTTEHLREELVALCSDYLNRLSVMAPSIEMHAQNEAVGILLRALVSNGQALLAALNDDYLPEHLDRINLSAADAERLRNACRWDLGLNGTDPKLSGPEPTTE